MYYTCTINNNKNQIIMKDSVREELMQHINDTELESRNHFTMFNEDYYIIGYYNASEWLKKHGIGEFEGASICREFEDENFGESQTVFDNSETLVNHLVYWYGQELCYELGLPNE